MRFARFCAVLLAVPLLAVPAPAAADPPAGVVDQVLDDTREPSERVYQVPSAGRRERTPVTKAPTPPVGAVRQWLALDDAQGRFYRKAFTLRAVGEHIEVWVAQDLAFPADDCRKDPVEVTDAQIAGLVTEFDTKIHPRETAAFSTPPDRDGTKATLDGDFTGDGGRTVTLIDNIRDDNFVNFPEAAAYIAGFFSAQLNALVDRNVMSIDAYDWEHRTGASPPDDATDDLCTSRPSKPRMYEATFAHEWQHLLQSYVDPEEETWVDEGLSDYAQSLVGYVDTRRSVYRRGADGHLACFQGFAIVRTAFNTTPRECGGPQNSLHLWNEGEPAEVLADYGIAYQFMLYLKDRFGAGVLSRIHRDRARHGLAGVAAALPHGAPKLMDVLHDFQVMTLVDKRTTSRDPRFTSRSLRSTVNLDNPAAYARPGAAPNGADYLRLPGHGRTLKSVTFTGARTLPPLPMTWTAADGALFSGNAPDLDATAALEVTVPAGDAELRLTAKYGAESGFDYGYVIVSANRGRTWTAVRGDRTTGGPLGPGISGDTGGEFVAHRYDLSPYAGRTIFLGFRYVTDAAIDEGGWYVKDIDVGGTTAAADPALFRSVTQIRPAPVAGWHVRLVGLDGGRFRQVSVRDFGKLRAYPKVVAIVAQDDPTGRVTQYAPYTLTVNGERLPG